MVRPVQKHRIYEPQAALFRALAHPTRISILAILGEGEQCVCHLEAILGLRQSYISQHLMVLRDAGLVVDRRKGWNIFYRPAPRSIAKLSHVFKIISGALPPKTLRTSARDSCPCPKCSRKQARLQSLGRKHIGTKNA
jgi:DNA-binding transcriptional ArsR family regulator